MAAVTTKTRRIATIKMKSIRVSLDVGRRTRAIVVDVVDILGCLGADACIVVLRGHNFTPDPDPGRAWIDRTFVSIVSAMDYVCGSAEGDAVLESQPRGACGVGGRPSLPAGADGLIARVMPFHANAADCPQPKNGKGRRWGSTALGDQTAIRVWDTMRSCRNHSSR